MPPKYLTDTTAIAMYLPPTVFLHPACICCFRISKSYYESNVMTKKKVAKLIRIITVPPSIYDPAIA